MPMNEQFNPWLSPSVTVPEESDRLRTFLIDELTRNADVTNEKKIGNYALTENYSGETWWYGTDRKKIRNGYQLIINIPVLPNIGALILNDGVDYELDNVNSEFRMTHCYGTATKSFNGTPGSGDYFSFQGNADPRITLKITDNQIIITTTADLTAYQAFIVLEYIRNN